MRAPLLGLALLTLCPAAASADDVSVFAAASVRRFDDGPHIGPDARTLRYEYSGRWRAAAGAELVLVGFETPDVVAGLALGGLLTLANEDDLAPVPFELLRASIGVDARVASQRLTLDPEHRVRFGALVGYAHESDHPASTATQVYRELVGRVPIDDFSSYEWVRIAGTYEHWFRDWLWFSLGLGVRLYPEPINPSGGRELTAAFELELRGRALFVESAGVFAALYAEVMGHELDPARYGLPPVPAVPFVVRAELGFTFATESVGRLDLYVGVVEEDGRGIDFIRHYGPDFLAGLRGSF